MIPLQTINLALTVEEISRLRMAQVYLAGLTRHHATGCGCWLCEAAFYAALEAGPDGILLLEDVVLYQPSQEKR